MVRVLFRHETKPDLGRVIGLVSDLALTETGLRSRRTNFTSRLQLRRSGWCSYLCSLRKLVRVLVGANVRQYVILSQYFICPVA